MEKNIEVNGSHRKVTGKIVISMNQETEENIFNEKNIYHRVETFIEDTLYQIQNIDNNVIEVVEAKIGIIEALFWVELKKIADNNPTLEEKLRLGGYK